MNHVRKVIIFDPKHTRNNVVRFLENTKCTATTSRVNDSTRSELIKATGFNGFVLFHYYVGKQNVPNFLFTDESACKALHTPLRKIASIRRALIKANWFIQYNEYYDKLTQEYVIRTILGKDNVMEYTKISSTKDNLFTELLE